MTENPLISNVKQVEIVSHWIYLLSTLLSGKKNRLARNQIATNNAVAANTNGTL